VLVNTVCLALEVHAQMEEEIFYPAIRAEHPAIVDKSVPEHEERAGSTTAPSWSSCASRPGRWLPAPGSSAAAN
jgi:hypothetical protein